jgi:8-oxo-dGTP diphosphatase
VHWTSAVLAAAAERPRDLVCSASCHTHEEIARAGALALDFAVLGPVWPTPTHPGAVTLGWEGFEAAAANAALPILALGGLSRADLDDAVAHGAHGLALRRGAWP